MTIVVERLLKPKPEEINISGLNIDDTWKIVKLEYSGKNGNGGVMYSVILYNKKIDKESFKSTIVDDKYRSYIQLTSSYYSWYSNKKPAINIVEFMKECVKDYEFIAVSYHIRSNRRNLEKTFHCKFNTKRRR